MIAVHNHTEAAISSTLLYPERYTWLHETHSRLHNHTDFTEDLLGLISRYHPKAKTLNPQGRSLKLTNNWVIPPRLCQAIETTFLTTTEIFGNSLNCSMSDGITYCSTFPKDAVFGAIMNYFQLRWTSSCIVDLEYEPEDMLKAVVYALASSESNKNPFLIVLILPVWDDTPWNYASVRGHRNISNLIRIPTETVATPPRLNGQ
jgi:hypothetical protein